MRASLTFIIAVLLSTFWLLSDNLNDLADDPGLGWHLKNGEIITLSGRIPFIDPFLAEPRHWISDQWIADIILYNLFQLGGWPLLYAVAALLFISSYFLVLVPACMYRANLRVAAALALTLCFGMGLVHFILRPVLLGNILFALCAAALFRFHQHFTRRKDSSAAHLWFRRAFIMLPPLFVVWANIHPSFVMGLLLLGLLSASLIFDKFVLSYKFDSLIAPKAVLLTIVCGLATVATPFGPELHESIFALGRSDFFMNLNSEWKPLSFHHLEGFLFESAVFIILLAAFLKPRQFSNWSSFDFLLLLVFGHFAVTTARMLPYFSIIAAPLLTESIHAISLMISERLGWNVERKLTTKSLRIWAVGIPSVVALALAIILISSALSQGRLPLYAGPFGPSTRKYPYAAFERLVKTEGPLIVYSTPNWGGFITLFGQGRIKPVLDDRNGLLGEAPYRQYLALQSGQLSWRTVANSHGADYVLLPRGKPMEHSLPKEGAELVYFDETAILLAVKEF